MKKIRLLYLGNQLAKQGFNKTTIETLGLRLEEEGFSVTYASHKKAFPIRMLHMLLSVFWNRHQVDYILIDTYSTKAYWYAFVCSQLARIFNLKYIPILHGGNLPSRLKNSPKSAQLLFANAYRNVAPSGYLQHEFEQAGFHNVLHIPNAIEIDNYTFTAQTSAVPKLLWVRAFATIYNPKMAVSVLSQLQQTHPNATLTMVGPDKDGSMIATKAFAEKLGVQVVFTGQLQQEEWWQLAAKHTIFINTTHFDNTPVSVMEAMALGLPVVSTNVGGMPYLLTDKENALLVAADDVAQMTTALLSVVANKETTVSMIQNARSFIAHMDWNVVKQHWILLLHETPSDKN
mgnify:CR=1 FL=1